MYEHAGDSAVAIDHDNACGNCWSAAGLVGALVRFGIAIEDICSWAVREELLHCDRPVREPDGHDRIRCGSVGDAVGAHGVERISAACIGRVEKHYHSSTLPSFSNRIRESARV